MEGKSFLVLLASLTLALALPTESGSNSKWAIGQSVKTTSGEVVGHEAAWPANSGISEYLGIPYGQPPTGNLRFERPVAFKGQGTIPGDKFGNECPQFASIAVPLLAKPPPAVKGLDTDLWGFGGALLSGKNATFGEDCLNINVWTKPQTGEKKKAVLVWIYGGAFSVGATSAPFYSPARYAADHDVVAVSLNYRLSILGFPMYDQLKDQNLGLYDQRLAIEWVRDNIEAFGGDPSRITIFGESAGGTSVDLYSYAWKKDPIVAGIISQSGTAVGLIGDAPNPKAWYSVSKAVGCGGSTSGTKTIACMKEVPVEKIMDNLGAVGGLGAVGTLLTFWPVSDGKIVFADILNREKAGGFMKRPMLIGSNEREGNLIVGAINIVKDVVKANPDMIPANFTGTVANVFKALDYMNSTGWIPGMARDALHFIEDGVFTCPASTAAAARAEANVPVWRYWFGHTFDNGNIGGYGSYHVSDVPYTMGTLERKVTYKKVVPEQEKYIQNVMKAWATFAKDPENGLTKMGWPKYNPKQNTLIRLGNGNKANAEIAAPSAADKNCAKYSIPPSAPKYVA